MENSNQSVVVAGHICLDIIPAFVDTGIYKIDELLVPGKLIEVEKATISTGGPVSNTGLNLAKLGVGVKLMGKIGKDEFGRLVTSLLAEKGFREGMIVSEGEKTSYTIALAPPKIDRIFLHCPGANHTFVSSDIDYDVVRGTKLFHLGYPPLMKGLYSNEGKELAAIFKRVKELGATTSLDLSLPDPKSEAGKANWDLILQKTLPYVDICVPSAEESMFMLNRNRFDDLRNAVAGKDALDSYAAEDVQWLGEKLISYGAKIVMVKCGHRGIYLRTSGQEELKRVGRALPGNAEEWPNRELWEQAFLVENIASATGSGDSSIAGFLAAYLNGEGPERCLKIACCLGAQNVMVLDAVSGVHSWEESIGMMDGWKKVGCGIESEANWKQDKSHGILVGKLDKEFTR